MLRKTVSGILAGALIAIGGCAYLGSDIRELGALFFCAGLYSVCFFGFSLYTGRVGYMVVDHSREKVSDLLWGLFGNFIGASAVGWAMFFTKASIAEKALASCTTRLETPLLHALIHGVFCGVLIYLAVAAFKEKGGPLGILLCIPAFILPGFEHSVADMFYFAAAGLWNLDVFVFIFVVIIGNGIGSIAFLALRNVAEGVKKNDKAS